MISCRSCLVVLAAICFAQQADAQAMPDTGKGRYTLAPVADGVVRLDTASGTVSTCTNKDGGWACYAIPDERAAFDAEIGRLQKDNDALRAQLALRDTGPDASPKTSEALPKEDSLTPNRPNSDLPRSAEGSRKIEIPKIEIPLPSDRDIDRALGFLESAWRRLVEMAARLQRDASGRI